jgi:SAM-dependent methyltransferase
MGLFRRTANTAVISPQQGRLSPIAESEDRKRAEQHWTWIETGLRAMREGDAPAHIRAPAELLAELKRSTKKRYLSLLDVGCGSAFLSEVLQHYLPGWCWYVGADASPAMLRLARRQYPEAILSAMDPMQLVFEPASFDLVYSTGTWDRLREWEEALLGLCRVSRGWVLLHRVRVVLDGATALAPDGEGWRVAVAETELLTAMGKAGFRRVKTLVSGEGRQPSGQESHTYLFERLPARSQGDTV